MITASPVAGRAFIVIVWASRSSAQSLSAGSAFSALKSASCTQ